jgi:SAM-dependent methyltransferase
MVEVLLTCTKNAGNKRGKVSSIKDIPRGTLIWNAETTRAMHEKLSLHLGQSYVSSEFIDPGLESGQTRDGILHVDVQATHFKDESFDLVLSSEVLEHVPRPLVAMEEAFRVLKPGGFFIFTAPFYLHRFTNEIRALVDEQGVTTYLRRPWYHDDPMHADGALTYTIFAPEILCQLEAIGFEARLCRLYAPFHGILGSNGIVVVACKGEGANRERDWIFPD